MFSPKRRAVLLCLSVLAATGCRSNSEQPLSTPDGGDTDPDVVLPLPDNIEKCDVSLPSVTGTCEVAKGTGTAIAIRGDVLGETTIFENGTVVVDGEKIVCVGCDCSDAPGFDTATVLSCPEAAISPGLINPHDHLTFTEGSPIDHGSTRYNHRHEWRKELKAPQNPHGTGNTSDGNRWGELRMLLGGVTTMVGSGKATSLIRNLDRLDERDRNQGFEQVTFETFSLGDSKSSSTNRPDCDWNYKNTETEVAEMEAFLPHVAEGINDYAATEFRCQSKSFGPAEDFTEKNATHIHSIGLTAADYFNMARDQTRLLWSPRSNISLYGMTAAVQTFHRLGGTVALGTDWTYSGSANMPRELACADEFNRHYLDSYFSDKDVFDMATINAARATASEELIGSLAEGKLADISIFGGEHRYYRSVFSATNEAVALVMVSGKALMGDANLMEELGSACDPIDVCGTAKTVCATSEFEKSFAAIQAAVSEGKAAYPAFFCGVPTDEPTCVPSRPGEFTGEATDDDQDGDGIADADDNCPQVFNPIRPMDTLGQEDADFDGIGDACDDTPLPADLDKDGTGNHTDNCPFDANQDQKDGDLDRKGDACDFCPENPNPDFVCPEIIAEATIGEVQDGTIEEGVKVLIKDVVVTAVWANGFWIQDPNLTTYAGVQVYSGSNHGVHVGQLVDVKGSTVEFHGDTEIEKVTITKKGDATPINPTVVTVEEAAKEEYEGMLVTLSDIDSFVDPYDCVVDDSKCSDKNLWSVNGSILVYDRVYADDNWAERSALIQETSGFTVTGVMTYRFARRRIQPRTEADLTPAPTPPSN